MRCTVDICSSQRAISCWASTTKCLYFLLARRCCSCFAHGSLLMCFHRMANVVPKRCVLVSPCPLGIPVAIFIFKAAALLPYPTQLTLWLCLCARACGVRRRLLQNPSYYDLDSTEPEAVSAYLSAMVADVLMQLQVAGCLEVGWLLVHSAGSCPVGCHPSYQLGVTLVSLLAMCHTWTVPKPLLQPPTCT